MNKYCIILLTLWASTGQTLTHVPIGTRSSPSTSVVRLELLYRFQSYNSAPDNPNDVYDTDIFSPKSVRSESDKIFVNSLEGMKTVVYRDGTFEKLATIKHTFDTTNASLLSDEHVRPFSGKPVESALSHGGRFLWVPYYRRDHDTSGTQASAVAVINTRTLAIERVFSTGPVAKYASASPDGKYMVISNWGNNTLSVFNIEGSRPDDFSFEATLVVDHVLDLRSVATNRDKSCGFCLRGLAFTKDSRYLFVARMGGGGIAVFDFHDRAGISYLGTVHGLKPTPRDILLSPDGEHIYVSSNVAGYVTRVAIHELISAVYGKAKLKGLSEVHIGNGVRSIRISKDGRYLFAAVHANSELVVLDANTLSIVARAAVDSYPVGLEINSDGTHLWVTSQGVEGKGGNSVTVYEVTYPSKTQSIKIPG